MIYNLSSFFKRDDVEEEEIQTHWKLKCQHTLVLVIIIIEKMLPYYNRICCVMHQTREHFQYSCFFTAHWLPFSLLHCPSHFRFVWETVANWNNLYCLLRCILCKGSVSLCPILLSPPTRSSGFAVERTVAAAAWHFSLISSPNPQVDFCMQSCVLCLNGISVCALSTSCSLSCLCIPSWLVSVHAEQHLLLHPHTHTHIYNSLHLTCRLLAFPSRLDVPSEKFNQ